MMTENCEGEGGVVGEFVLSVSACISIWLDPAHLDHFVSEIKNNHAQAASANPSKCKGGNNACSARANM